MSQEISIFYFLTSPEAVSMSQRYGTLPPLLSVSDAYIELSRIATKKDSKKHLKKKIEK